MDALLKIIALIGAAVPLIAFVPSVRDFLFGHVVDGTHQAPRPLARAVLAALGGIFAVGAFFLLLTFNTALFIYTTNGSEGLATDNNGVAGSTSKCDSGILVSGSCNVIKGGGTLFNAGVNGGAARCTWIKTDPTFTGQSQAICLHVGIK